MRDSKLVLIVEDDESIRELMADFLKLEGFQVAMAAHGQEALDLIAQGKTPHVILLDLMMPVMSGWEFLDHREKDGHLKDIPVIVLSAATQDRMNALKADEVLRKPLELDDLLASIDKHL